MKLLEYNIAWIDDQPDKAQGYKERLASKLGREGLELQVDWVCDAKALDAFLAELGAESDIDLILVDWKLGQKMPISNGSGANVAKLIRDKHSYANIVFYSATEAENLRKLIADERIDGVYCVNRQHFVEDVWYVVKSNLRKLFDFNSMRGLYMAAVAEFDEEIKTTLLSIYSKSPDAQQTQIKEAMISLKSMHLKETVASIEALDKSKHLSDIIKGVAPGSWELCQSLSASLLLRVVDGQHAQAKQKLDQYQTEVLGPRNDLAHGKAAIKNGKKELHRAGRTYNKDSFANLRQTLIEHHENIELIKTKISTQMVTQIANEKNSQQETH